MVDLAALKELSQELAALFGPALPVSLKKQVQNDEFSTRFQEGVSLGGYGKGGTGMLHSANY